MCEQWLVLYVIVVNYSVCDVGFGIWSVDVNKNDCISKSMRDTVTDKKIPPLCNFFCFDHIFVIPWVWVENLISFESWDFELFHCVKIFLYFEDIFSYHFWNKNHTFFFINLKISLLPLISKKFFICENFHFYRLFCKKNFWKI